MNKKTNDVTYFYDTCAILNNYDNLDFTKKFYISSTTLEELEHIKTSGTKSEEVKFKARKVIHLLNDNIGKYEVIVSDNDIYSIVNEKGLPINNDNLIIACAYSVSKEEPIVFISEDLACKMIAMGCFKLNVDSLSDKKNDDKIEYKGYKEVQLSDKDMAYFYEHLNENKYDCLQNEYINIKNFDDDIIDTRRWDGNSFVELYKKSIRSVTFGDKIKPKDTYQHMVIDSIMNNTITAISGKAGSGKSLLSLVCIMNLIETGKYDTLVVLYNPTKVKGASDMGYYSGNATEKAMQNSIGGILTTKFGDRFAIDLMIQQNKLKLVNMADARGIEIRDNEILWISETQNISAELLKLCLSRCSSDAKIVIEGDFDSQVDSYAFEGNRNGMKRAIEVLKGEDIFGYVKLQQVFRSKLAELVDKM